MIGNECTKHILVTAGIKKGVCQGAVGMKNNQCIIYTDMGYWSFVAVAFILAGNNVL